MARAGIGGSVEGIHAVAAAVEAFQAWSQTPVGDRIQHLFLYKTLLEEHAEELAAGLVLEHGGDIDQAAAAILHDTLEDCPEVTVSELERRFGPRVTRMVIDCSDTIASENGAAGSSRPTWQERKDAYLVHLGTADQESVLVAFCDKVHNLGTITDDLLEDGPASLDRFTASPERQVWYFRRVLEMAGPRVPTKLRRRLDTLLSTFRAAVSEP